MTIELENINSELENKGLPVDETLEEEVVVADDDIETVEIIEDDEPVTQQGGDDTQLSEEEIQASEQGWKPEGDWDGDPAEWVTAKQFLRNGEYLRKIHNQNRKIKELDGVVTTLAKQQKKIFDAGYDKAKRDLKAAHRVAIREGDDDTVELIEKRIEELDERRAEDVKDLEPVGQPKKSELAPEFTSWVQRNDWFVKHPEMRAYAEVIGVKYAQDNPEKSNTEIYGYVTEQAKKKFPERFGTMKKQEGKKPASVVEGNGKLSGVRKNDGTPVRVSLTPEEKSVGRTLVQRGVYKDMNEYASDLKKMGVKG